MCAGSGLKHRNNGRFENKIGCPCTTIQRAAIRGQWPGTISPDVYRIPWYWNCRVPCIHNSMGQPEADIARMPQDVIRHHARQAIRICDERRMRMPQSVNQHPPHVLWAWFAIYVPRFEMGVHHARNDGRCVRVLTWPVGRYFAFQRAYGWRKRWQH